MQWIITKKQNIPLALFSMLQSPQMFEITSSNLLAKSARHDSLNVLRALPSHLQQGYLSLSPLCNVISDLIPPTK